MPAEVEKMFDPTTALFTATSMPVSSATRRLSEVSRDRSIGERTPRSAPCSAISIANSSSDALPARSPMPFTVPCTMPTPCSMAASVLAVARAEIVVEVHRDHGPANVAHPILNAADEVSHLRWPQHADCIGKADYPRPRAFHTPLVSDWSELLRRHLNSVRFHPLEVPVYSTLTTKTFPEEADAVRDWMARQWSSTVRFKETIEQIYEDGVPFRSRRTQKRVRPTRSGVSSWRVEKASGAACWRMAFSNRPNSRLSTRSPPPKAAADDGEVPGSGARGARPIACRSTTSTYPAAKRRAGTL
jgi:hypothetical protein